MTDLKVLCDCIYRRQSHINVGGNYSNPCLLVMGTQTQIRSFPNLVAVGHILCSYQTAFLQTPNHYLLIYQTCCV